VSDEEHDNGLPPDPFAGDPEDPAHALHSQADPGPIEDAERAELIEDLRDLDVYESLLAPRGVLGVVVDCEDCQEPHYHEWSLLRASLEQLLKAGHMRPHEPAFDPDPECYVTWEYCRGFADGANATQHTS
jgi:hypothetical protein